MARKRLTKAQKREQLRLKRKRVTNKAALAFLRSELPGVDLAAIPRKGILNAYRRSMNAPLHPAVLVVVLRKLTTALDKDFAGDSKIKPAHFGLKDSEALAKLFVEMMERTDYAAYTVKELRDVADGPLSRTPGLRSTFAGELFELVGRNHPGLQADLRSLADDLLNEMDKILNGNPGTRPPLLDGDGNVMSLAGTFGRVRKLSDVVDHVVASDSLKFTDFMYVAEFTPSNGSEMRLAILHESEFKLPGAARELPEQVGKALGRMTTAEGISGVFEDGSFAVYERKNLIFSQTAMTKSAISPAAKPGYRWVTTKKGGYSESFMRVRIEVDVDQIYRVVNLLFNVSK